MPTTPTIDASTPAVVQGSTATTSTAPFQPPAGSWIVASVQADANTGATDERLTVATTQAGITFVCAVFLTGTPAASEIWVAYVTVSASMTVDITDNKGAVPKRGTVRVYRDMGGVGATATITSAVSVSYTATMENSLGIASGLASNVLPSAGTGCTVIDETTGFDSGDSVFTVGRTASLGTLAGSTVTLSVTGPTGVRLVAAELLPTVVGPPPQPLPPWLLTQILVEREQSLTGGATAGPTTIQATADLIGAGSVTANVTEIVTASPAGAGAVAANATLAATVSPAGGGALAVAATLLAPASPAGAGALTANVTEVATASPAGAGSLTANVTRIVTAAPAGAGAVTANVTEIVTASPAGAGSVTANVRVVAPVTATGAGVLTAPGTIAAPATPAGAGALSALVTEIAIAAPTGAGAVDANGTAPGGTVQGTASLVGAGALTANATVQAVATPTGAGTLAANTTVRATAVLTGAGALSAAGVTPGPTTVGRFDSAGAGTARLDGPAASTTEVESLRAATGSVGTATGSSGAAEGTGRATGSLDA